MKPIHRVLLVEDHEPFRRVISALLLQRPDVLLVGEATDGPDAVRQAAMLQPDVVLLDLSLPTMSGLEVASRIRDVAPHARLLLVTNESSLDVIEEAFRRGAHGYVYKPRARRDLPSVLEAVLAGGRFVSGSLERIARGDSLASHRHDVLFCSSDAVLVSALTRFVAGALRNGRAVIVLATEAHGERLHRGLAADVTLGGALREGRYVPLNIDDLLSKIMVDGWPHRERFLNAAEDVFTEAARRATSQSPEVAACGECAPTLWAQGHFEAAIELEHLWDELANTRRLDTLCVYPLVARQQHGQAFSLCAEHTAVEFR